MAYLCRLTCWLSVMLSAVSLANVRAETRAREPGESLSERAILFRRHLVSEKDIRDQAQGYMPIRKEDFQRLLAEINAGPAWASQNAPVRVVRGAYAARLEGDQLIAGQAQLELLRTRQVPSILKLIPCQLAITKLSWANDESATVNMGIDPVGDPLVLVDRDASLQFAWTLRGVPTALGQRVFRLQLPASAMNELVLDLPSETLPVLSAGFAQPLSEDRSDTSGIGAGQGAGRWRDHPSRRSWRLELAGSGATELRIVPETLPLSQQQLVLARQASVYRFTDSGLELQIRFTLDVYHQSLDRLEVNIGPGLHLIAAQIGNQPLTISPATSADASTQISLAFPSPILGLGRELVLTAYAPLVTDDHWHLPDVQLAKAVWQQGTARLEVPGSLVLKSLTTDKCIETTFEPAASAGGGETRQFQLLKPGASLEVVLGFPTEEVSLVSGTTVRINETRITGRVVAHVTGQRGTLFELNALRLGNWVIDHVETTPSEAVDHVLLPGRHDARLRIPLARSLQPDQTVTFSITAHRQALAVGQSIEGKDLRILEFSHAVRRRHLVSILAEPPFRLSITGDLESDRRIPLALSADERVLIEASDGAYVYYDEAAANPLSVRLTREDPRYRATIAVEATVDPLSVKCGYTIRCEPISSRVAHLLVRFSRSSVVGTSWQLVGEDSEALTARRREASDPADIGETWEVVLRRPRSEPFTIQAVRSVACDAATDLALASLPEATSQMATLWVGTNDGTAFSMAVENVKSAPSPPTPVGEYSASRALYRYDPSRNAVAVVTRVAEIGTQSPAWAWSARLVSRYETAGTASHVAVFRLENTGIGQTTLVLPSSVHDVRCLVDGEEVPRPAQTSSPLRLGVPLPRGARFPCIRVEYLTDGKPLGYTRALPVPWPTIDLACLEQSWVVCLPPGYRAVADDRSFDPGRSQPLRWDERLFGISLARSDARPFDLFSGVDWKRLSQRIAERPAVELADQLLATLERISIDLHRGAEASPNWDDLVSAYSRLRHAASHAQLPDLMIDDLAFRALGITRLSPLTPPGIDPAAAHPSQFLDRAGIAVVVSRDEAILTGREFLPQFAKVARRADRQNVAILAAGQTWREVVTSRGKCQEIWSADDWLALPPPLTPPWPQSREITAAERLPVGWSSFQFQTGHAPALPVVVYRARVLDMLGATILLIVAGLSASVLRRQHTVRVAAIAVSAAAAILAPAELVPLSRGLFLGVFLAAAWGIVRRTPRSRPRLGREDSGTVTCSEPETCAQIPGLLLLAASVGCFFPHQAAGAENRAANSDLGDVLPVLIPVDDQQQPTGEYVFVPFSFYQSLYRYSDTAKLPPRAWLIHSASYDVDIRDGAELLDLEPSADIAAQYDVEVFQPQAEVSLPLGREGLVRWQATLDGWLVSPTWDSAGHALLFHVDSPRKLRLNLSLRPRIHDLGSSRGFDFSIPTLARSSVRVRSSPDVRNIQLPTSVGALSQDTPDDTLAADLGPANRLSVRWDVSQPGLSSTAQTEVRELFLLRILPNAVFLDAKFSFTVRRGALRQIELLADPRLRLLPLSPKEPVVRQTIEAGPQQRIRLELDQPYYDEVVVQTSFLVNGTSGIGDVPQPTVRAVADSVPSRVLGIWLAPNLTLQVTPELQDSSLAVAEFTSLWGTSDPPPQQCFRLPAEAGPTVFTVRPSRGQTQVQEELDLSIGLDRAFVAFRARIELRDGYRLQQRLAVPREMVIRDLVITQDNLNRVARWSHDGVGKVTAFFSGPVTGEQMLVMQGEMPVPRTLPRVSLEDADTRQHAMRIYRRSDVALTVTPAAGLEPDPEARLGEYVPGKGRLVASWKTRPSRSSADVVGTLTTKANRQIVQGRLVTRLSFRGDSWEVNAELRAHVRSGSVDSIRWDIPAELAEDYEFQPDLPCQLQESLDSNRKILVAWPAQPAQGEILLCFRGTVKPAASEQTRAPDITVLDVDELSRFLVVPTRLGQQPIGWETSGLRAVPLPTGLSVPDGDSKTNTAFQVVGSKPQAILKDVERVSGAPQVRLADVRLAWRPGARCYGVASFDLEPARLSEVELDLPRTLTLVHVRVANLPIVAQPLRPGRWRFPLGPDQLPHRIEVIFSGRLPSAAAYPQGQPFPAPTLIGLPVLKTLWTVQGPPGSGAGQPLLAHTRTEPLQQAKTRLAESEDMLNYAADIVAQSGMKGFESWQTDWQRRIDVAQREVVRLRSRSLFDSTYVGEARQLVDDAYPPALLGSDQAVAPADVWSELQDVETPATRSALDGPSASFVVDYHHGHRDDLLPRIAIATGTLAAAAVILTLRRSMLLSEWFVRWPFVAGALIGLAWWLWLTPSLLGLVIVLACALGSLRTLTTGR